MISTVCKNKKNDLVLIYQSLKWIASEKWENSENTTIDETKKKVIWP